ncbi:alpha/beta hydrolase fold domain-containing protein [Novosphingobium sp.]|uniref:alpha/beta hydrolase fold domain-containing protein n=1 Tax=Novosphingobium sp. TaxID=1874826 RepID=UPI002633A083|nr:alpha/beta hydrolase fold domain-containing protein [Novosphingobium sp.]
MQISRRMMGFGIIGMGATAMAAGVGFALGEPASTASARETADPLKLVDPELRIAAREMLKQPMPAPSIATLPAMRTGWVPPPVLMAPAPGVLMQIVPASSGVPPVPIEVIGAKLSSRPRPAILHIHGGGMVSGRARNSTAFSQMLAAEFDAVVVNVDYRLSPETPFPGPVLDNYAALEWMVKNASQLGIDTTRIAIMGESAGGGLAAMVALMARDKGQIKPCRLVMLYPMLDDRTGSTRSAPPHIGTIGWSAEANRFGWTSFLGTPAGSSAVPDGSVPARVGNLAGLPPTFIGVGTLDLFIDEDVEFARRLDAAGVPTDLHVTQGAYHAFDFLAPEARVSREFAKAWKSGLHAAFGT